MNKKNKSRPRVRINLCFDVDKAEHRALYELLTSAPKRAGKVDVLCEQIYGRGSKVALPVSSSNLSVNDIDAIVNKRVSESLAPILAAMDELGRKIDNKTLISNSPSTQQNSQPISSGFDVPDVPDAALAGLNLFKSK